MNDGFTNLVGRSNKISLQLQHLQLSVDMQHREPDVSLDELLKWINPVSTHDDYDVALQARMKNTCDWASDTPSFQTWLASDPLSKVAKVLWWHGRPGSGKSILTASLVEYLRKHRSEPVCFFFCFYNHEGKRRCNNIVGSWVSQLVRTSEIASRIAKEVYKKKESHIALQVELWRIFREANVQLEGCFFVIDGFDECVREDASARSFSHLDDRASFLQHLDGAISNTQARVLIVSREDVDIRGRLRLSLDHNVAGTNWNVWTEYEMTLDDTAKDIERFSLGILEHKLSSSRTTAESKEELATDAATKSEGMFLWIKLLYARLSSSNSPSRLRGIISSTPSGLDQAYERDLEAISSLGEDDQIRAIAILRWTLFAERPLTVRELSEALIVERDLGDEYQEPHFDSLKSENGSLDQSDIPEVWDEIYVEDRILKLCGSLIVVRGKDPDQPIEEHAIDFVHFSVKEYLLKVDLFVSTSRAQTRIAISCFRYLCYDDFYQEQNSSLEEFNYKIKRYSFLRYASIYIYNHLANSRPAAPALIQLCNRLLDPKACKWLSFSEIWCSDEFESYENYITKHRDNYHSPLYLASFLGQIETIEWLLEQREDVNHVGGYYGCPLSAAATYGYQDAVKLMLASGANPNQSGGELGNPLQSAAAWGNEAVVTTLLASGAFVNQTGGSWHAPIIAASRVHDPKISKAIVCRLLQAGANVKITTGNGLTALHAAAYMGLTEVIECLLEHGAEINARDDDGRTPLYSACNGNNEEAIRALIDKGADVNAVSAIGMSPLHELAYHGSDALVNLLLDHGADVNARESHGYTALHKAAWEGHISTIELLLSRGADVDARDVKDFTPLASAVMSGHTKAVAYLMTIGANTLPMKNDRAWTLLHLASRDGHEDVIKFLLANGSDVNAVDKNEWTALHLAAQSGHEKVIEFLLANGSDVNAVDKNEWTALHLAAQSGHEKVIEFLLANGSDVNAVDKNEWTALHLAAQFGHEKVIEFLLANGSDVNAVTQNGRTALHLAASFRHEKIIECLLASGSHVNAVDEEGSTALHFAAGSGHEKFIEFLFASGGDVNAVDKNEWTALHVAAFSGHEKVIEFLLANGSHVNAVDKEESTALHWAAFSGHEKVIEFLLASDSHVNAVTQRGLTALHLAANYGHGKAIEFLLSKGADIEAADYDGNTTLHVAVIGQKLTAVKILLQHGASLQAKDVDGKTPLDLAREYDEDEAIEEEDDDDEGDDDQNENENSENDKEDKAQKKDERKDVAQKIMFLLETWEKPEQQTAT